MNNLYERSAKNTVCLLNYLQELLDDGLREDVFIPSNMSSYSNELSTAWGRFDAAAVSRLKKIRHSERDMGTFRLFPNANRLLYEAAEELEKGTEFSQLLQAIQSDEIEKGFHKKSDLSFWEHALTNVLRRSGYYHCRIESRENPPEVSLPQVMSQFDRREKVITFLAPMEYLHLEIDEVQCDTFFIKKFTKAELDQLFETSLCEAFYPWAVVDTAILCDYLFIVMTEQRPISPLGRINANLAEIGKVRARYSPFPAIERALQTLALVDWQPDWTRNDDKKGRAEWKGWLGFRIPFLLRHSDNLLDRPALAPNLSTLDREPYFNPWTGEEEGEKPAHYISFRPDESELFINKIRNIDHLLVSVEPAMEAWPFVGRAFGFLVKGFFSSGLEQLLWHMTTLEALFGEDQRGVTKRLKSRIGSVLANTASERTELEKQFGKLYNFRSRLVHGDEFGKQVWAGHLKDARDMARRCLLWFLHLAQVAINAKATGLPDGLLKRQEILALIDLDRKATDRMAKVITLAPSGFPSIKEWTD